MSMAQGVQRPRHNRQPSRLLRLAGPNDHRQHGRRDQRQDRSVDADTVWFIRKTLIGIRSSPARTEGTDIEPDSTLEEYLPPLTSSDEVDVQLYGIIAAILSQFVQSWYNRVTHDHQFVEDILQIIAHCTRGLESRLRQIDLETLLLDELPDLLIMHVEATRTARGPSRGERSSEEVRKVYHYLNPNKALTPLPDSTSSSLEQQENEIAWSQLLVSRVLPLVLPPEDLQNPCLHVLVSEVFSEMIVHRALCEKAAQPWIIWEGVTKLISSLRPGPGQRASADPGNLSINRLEQYGLLSAASAHPSPGRQETKRGIVDSVGKVFWAFVQVAAIVWLVARTFVVALMRASSIPSRRNRISTVDHPHKDQNGSVISTGHPVPQYDFKAPREKRPVVAMRIWTCVATLTVIERRMPWLSGCLSLIQWLSLYGPGKMCRTDSVLDRLTASQISERLSRPGLLPSVLRAIRGALSPDNMLAAAREPPTGAEAAEMKRKCAQTIVNVVPMPVRTRFFATEDEEMMRQDVEDTLDLFDDAYINKHLIISAVELIVVRLFPELAADSIDW